MQPLFFIFISYNLYGYILCDLAQSILEYEKIREDYFCS